MKIKLTYTVLFLFVCSVVTGQQLGNLSGGFHSESQFYKEDKTIGASVPDEKMASNNYLKLDYNLSNFTFGVRYEAYLPPLLGYPQELKGNGIVNRYASYQNDLIKVTAGNFYEQFGAGLVLRAYEERLLGVDNSLDGVKIELNPFRGIDLTALYGKQRSYFNSGDGIVRGGDTNIRIGELLNFERFPMTEIGFSMVSKFEEYTGPDGYGENVNAYSARASVIAEKFIVDAEYVEKDIDPSTANNYDQLRKGRALLINSSFFIKGLGINATFRRVENMDFRSERTASQTNLWMNYIPAETKQHGYLLPNIYPYAVQSIGETGGQLNVSYTIKKKSLFGGKYGTKLALNFSQYNTLKDIVDPALSLESFNTNMFEFGDSIIYRDFNVEIKKKLSKSYRTSLNYISIEYNKLIIEGVPTNNVKSNIGVWESLIRLPKRKSIRTEVQHLWTKEDKGNWAAAVVEFNLAPSWSFFIMDQYNYGTDKKPHYYLGGLSFVKKTTRLAMSYGRQRGGLLCVGGVCRNVPSANGLNLTVSTTF